MTRTRRNMEWSIAQYVLTMDEETMPEELVRLVRTLKASIVRDVVKHRGTSMRWRVGYFLRFPLISIKQSVNSWLTMRSVRRLVAERPGLMKPVKPAKHGSSGWSKRQWVAYTEFCASMGRANG